MDRQHLGNEASSANMAKIIINARFLTQPVTGVQRYAQELVQAIDQMLVRGAPALQRHDWELLAPRRGLLRTLPLQRIPLRQAGLLTGHWWEQVELPFLAGDGVLFCPGNTAPLLGLLTRRRLVVTLHDLAFRTVPDAYRSSFRLGYRLLSWLILRLSRATITVSEHERRNILRWCPAAVERLHTVLNGGLSRQLQKLAAEEPTASPSSVKPFALFVGAQNKRKNLAGAMAAVAQCNQEEEIPLVVVGQSGQAFSPCRVDPPEPVKHRVHFRRDVDRTEDLVRLYRTARCLVFPSHYEGFGLPPLEAMACGCPVVASKTSAMPEVCGDAALYCDPDDPGDIATQLLRLWRDPDLRDQLRAKGRERARQFTWERCAQETCAILDRVAGE